MWIESADRKCGRLTAPLAHSEGPSVDGAARGVLEHRDEDPELPREQNHTSRVYRRSHLVNTLLTGVCGVSGDPRGTCKPARVAAT